MTYSHPCGSFGFFTVDDIGLFVDTSGMNDEDLTDVFIIS